MSAAEHHFGDWSTYCVWTCNLLPRVVTWQWQQTSQGSN